MTLRAVHVRLNPAHAAALDAAATAEGISPTGWVRAVLARALPVHSEIHSLPPSPRRRPTTIPAEDVAAIGRLVGTIGLCSGATIQLAKALREAGHAAHGDAELVLRDLRSVQAQLVHVATALRHQSDTAARAHHEDRP